ncbi:hypothetical protein TWF696_001374 [Orbilia brochopaga]|uniref:GH18 domain-containing protein n=1 Tax=Orbilia brochopaga TaxID=3140254 RepID=A0AAV9UCG9_9PEZI
MPPLKVIAVSGILAARLTHYFFSESTSIYRLSVELGLLTTILALLWKPNADTPPDTSSKKQPGNMAPENRSSNGVWLDNAFVSSPSSIENVPRVANFLRDNLVDFWFVNIGALSRGGVLPDGIISCRHVIDFLSAVAAWEAANGGKKFKVLAWLTGHTDPTDPSTYIDVTDSTIRAAVVNQCRKIAVSSVENSYTAGANREFDGIQLQFEPAAPTSESFESLKALMREVRDGIGHGKWTSFVAPRYGDAGTFWWNKQGYHYLARYVDLLCASTYDFQAASPEDYSTWMKGQTTDILRAVSGVMWGNDKNHPAPHNMKVMLGFPAFPQSKQHSTAIETVAAAAKGTIDGLEALGDDKSSLGYFGGAAVYLYTDGSGKDGYSAESTDWAAFRQVWLGLE